VNPLVILSKREQEYLLRIVESALALRDLRQLFLWSQGQLQSLLPHQLMVCMQFDAEGSVQRMESLYSNPQDSAAMAHLCDPLHGLAVRMARLGLASGTFPCTASVDDVGGALAPLHAELASCGYDNVLVHGTGALAGGATAFALFGLPMRPGVRHAYFLSLLLPQLHLALLRLARPAGLAALSNQAAPALTRRALSARETEVLHYLREGKRNDEIADLLGISALTVKNHLQRIYKLLEVRNRTEAVARSAALRHTNEQIASAPPTC
jgi:transcriptional regulator EpsA